MSTTRAYIGLLILIAGIVGGCASYPKPQNLTEKQDQRAILNEGYSILYSNISSIALSHLVLLVKVESDTIDHVVTKVSEYAGTLKNTLERVAKDYPAINIELQPLPELEKRTRDAVVWNRIRSFTPFVGLTGIEFERRMLQSLEGPINQTRYLCKVMADEEPEPSLKHILTDAKSKFDRFYDEIIDLLNAQFYINDTNKNKK